MSAPTEEITQLLGAYQRGDQEALEKVFPLVYNELRRLAGSYLRREREDHTLQPTALVHEFAVAGSKCGMAKQGAFFRRGGANDAANSGGSRSPTPG